MSPITHDFSERTCILPSFQQCLFEYAPAFAHKRRVGYS
jgi:hypothetical protein